MKGQTEAVQVRRGGGGERFKDKNKAGRSSLVESHEVLWVSARVHVCIHCVSVCVCKLRQENLSTVSSLTVRGEKAGGKASHPLCSFILLHLF